MKTEQRLELCSQKPRNAQSHQRGQEAFSQRLWREPDPADTLILDFWHESYQKINFCGLQVCDNLL